MQMSPSDSSPFSSSPGSGGSGFSAAGRWDGEAEPGAVEDAGAEAEGDRQVRGGQAERLAGVVGRRQQVVVFGADHPAFGHFARRLRPLFHQFAQLGLAFGFEVEGGEVEAVLDRRRDPRLVLAVEGDRAGASAASAASASSWPTR